jgi:hypothetical protein
MERELWLTMYRWVTAHAKTAARPAGVRYTDAAVAAVWLWAVLHDRATSWAADARNWPRDLLTFELPSQSTLSRRLRTAGFRAFLAGLHDALAGRHFAAAGALVKVMDSKPLPVGAYSRAKDARWGRGARGQQRGYKLHALYGAGPLPLAWEVAPMNASEQRVARRLLGRGLGDGRGGGYVLADRVYDVNDLYPLAAARGHQLLAPRKRPGGNVGERARDPGRLRAIDLLEGPCPAFGRALYAGRTAVERHFARLCGGVGGLQGLPPFVRRLGRVNRWVAGKLLIDAARWYRKHRGYGAAA